MIKEAEPRRKSRVWAAVVNVVAPGVGKHRISALLEQAQANAAREHARAEQYAAELRKAQAEIRDRDQKLDAKDQKLDESRKIIASLRDKLTIATRANEQNRQNVSSLPTDQYGRIRRVAFESKIIPAEEESAERTIPRIDLSGMPQNVIVMPLNHAPLLNSIISHNELTPRPGMVG